MLRKKRKFCYQPNELGYPGAILQCKMIPWLDLYQTLIELPFCKCKQILIPWTPSLVDKLRIETERIDSFATNGYIAVTPFVRKED